MHRSLSCTAAVTRSALVRSSASSAILPSSSVSSLTSRCLHSQSAALIQPTAASQSSDAVASPASFSSSSSPSLTRLVLDALKTGPKTRKQIYYTINRGPPAAAPASATPSTPSNAAAAASSSNAAKKKKGQALDDLTDQVHNYPTGLLRNPTHLSAILRKLSRGSRVWAKPYSSLEKHLGESEKASLAAITETHQTPAAKLVTKPSASWVYVLRDWMDPGFGAHSEEKAAKFQAKRQRQIQRREAAVQAAADAGRPFLMHRPPPISKRAARKLEAKQKEEKEKKRVAKAVKEYHEELGLKVKKTKEEKAN